VKVKKLLWAELIHAYVATYNKVASGKKKKAKLLKKLEFLLIKRSVTNFSYTYKKGRWISLNKEG